MHPPSTETVSGQSWEWLVDLSLRLNVAAEVIDAQAMPVLPAGTSHDASSFRRLLASGEPTVRSAMADALRSKSQVPVSVGHMQVLCCGLSSGGVLLLARTPSSHESPQGCQEDLKAIARWLADVVESSLTQPNSVNIEPYRLVSLRRIMAEATSRGSIRRIIGTFVEALNVWDDVRVRCYVEGATGGFLQYGSALSAIPSLFPDQITDDAIFHEGAVVRLSRGNAERLGVTLEPGDTLVCRVVVRDVAWVVFFSGMVDDREQIRVRAYSDILRESLSEVVSAVESRLVGEVSRAAVAGGESMASLAEAALGQLTAAVSGNYGAMVVTMTTGREAISVGHRDLLTSPEHPRRRRLSVKSSAPFSVMTVVIERDQTPFTGFERELIQAGVAVVHQWVQSALQQPHQTERRSGFRPVDVMFDQFAHDAIAAGRHASVIVVSVDAKRLSPGILPTWVARIRGEIRAGDYAGLLSEREIAVLLSGASEADASAVAARLMQMLKATDSTGAALHSAVGITTRSPGLSFENSIVGAARATTTSHR